ncbi:hypothetical protein [Paenibacillus koleovorans]|uniref:hypothetical protein n=1 Tax=Paenibacillus koleovorans TaxID=121608 RepID=UPI000FDCB3E8|nr:hypothetical protein [Paenibacillus koleovorans]
MGRRTHWSIYAIGVLLFIGITSSFVHNPTQLIIPIVIFGAVFLLWKFPPSRWRKLRQPRSYTNSASSRGRSARDKRKPMPFKVIQGNKKDDKDNDPPYPYH